MSIKRGVLSATGLAAWLLTGTAQAVLQDRDLDRNGVTDAFYDTDLDITWLRDANVNRKMEWADAVAWAAGFSFGGYDDWRLPTSDDCHGFHCTGSEMGHLWYVELGNTAGAPRNAGSFQRLQSHYYWSGTEDATGSSRAWVFYAGGTAFQGALWKGLDHSAMAVRPGDVATVPEPKTVALMLAGLGIVGVAMRRRQRRSGLAN